MTETSAKGASGGGIFLMLSGISCLSIAPILIKVGLAAALDPVALLALRTLVGASALWAAFSIYWHQSLRIHRRELTWCAVVAAANCSAGLCWVFALTRIDVSVATVIFMSYPAVVLALLGLIGERIRQLDLIRLALMLLGVYLVVGPGGHVDSIGILLVIGAAVFYALFLTLIQRFLHDSLPQTVTLYVVSLMAVIVSIVYLFEPNRWDSPSFVGWGVILGLGIVCTALSKLAIFAGIHRIGSREAALLGPLEPLLTVLWAILFLNERLSLVQWIGALIMIASAGLVVLQRIIGAPPKTQQKAVSI